MKSAVDSRQDIARTIFSRRIVTNQTDSALCGTHYILAFVSVMPEKNVDLIVEQGIAPEKRHYRNVGNPPWEDQKPVSGKKTSRDLARNRAKFEFTWFPFLMTAEGIHMTFEELDQRFPNGFDDAEIHGLALDYRTRTATLQLNLRGNLPDSRDRDVYRRAVLTLRTFYYLSIDPPDSDHLTSQWRKITVDGLPEDSAQFPLFEHLKSTFPTAVFCCRFYVHDWNSFIHIAARDAEFSWIEDAAAEGI